MLILLIPSCDQPEIAVIMKDVGIDIPQKDFIEMRDTGIQILTTEWGMEENVSKVKTFLDRAQQTGLKVVLEGGFSYTAWGFTDDDWDVLPRGKNRFGKRNVFRTG